ncbi:[Protein-PII] uridylyltransferase domain protein [Mycobacterium xenopi 4042]|uniref:[Protein-PII] uridylyltransferase domain protein n=1 Tax=Mycobacterium xenopi 4042 TaxID=1299334 RepID=X8E7A6_MYCXE|nr:[Protein-PII] uridylyltransferase domain protein [Mycobacterium xenopi 4042]
MPIAAATLSRLADAAPDLPTPWPPDVLDDLLVLLSAGRPRSRRSSRSTASGCGPGCCPNGLQSATYRPRRDPHLDRGSSSGRNCRAGKCFHYPRGTA